jgi:hypothetical protein
MGKFITGQNLEKAIYDIIWNAKETLLIVSPFIKLDDYFKILFDKHVNNSKLHLLIVFGKNENMVSKSLSKGDFDYFKKFLNVSVIYIPNLYGKYYANEKLSVLTSINLYDYSFKNNIEFGVLSEAGMLNNSLDNADQDAWNNCNKIIKENEAVFIKRPVFEKVMHGEFHGMNYINSEILLVSTQRFYWGVFPTKRSDSTIKKIGDFPDSIEFTSVDSPRPEREKIPSTSNIGYCIRTGREIPFNPNKPLSLESFQTWVFFSDWDFPESYCHKTGKPSNGKTSMRSPILL